MYPFSFIPSYVMLPKLLQSLLSSIKSSKDTPCFLYLVDSCVNDDISVDGKLEFTELCDDNGLICTSIELFLEARLARRILLDLRLVFCMTKVPLGPQLTVLRIFAGETKVAFFDFVINTNQKSTSYTQRLPILAIMSYTQIHISRYSQCMNDRLLLHIIFGFNFISHSVF